LNAFHRKTIACPFGLGFAYLQKMETELQVSVSKEQQFTVHAFC
jgi:hypothetical protein